MQVSHGCVRLYPEDIERLFPLVPIGTPGEFIYQPVKIGLRGDVVYAETHRDIYGLAPALYQEAKTMLERLGLAERVDERRLLAALEEPSGIPVPVSPEPSAPAEVSPAVFIGTPEKGTAKPRRSSAASNREHISREASGSCRQRSI
jgi:hypothetical protein